MLTADYPGILSFYCPRSVDRKWATNLLLKKILALFSAKAEQAKTH